MVLQYIFIKINIKKFILVKDIKISISIGTFTFLTRKPKIHSVEYFHDTIQYCHWSSPSMLHLWTYSSHLTVAVHPLTIIQLSISSTPYNYCVLSFYILDFFVLNRSHALFSILCVIFLWFIHLSTKNRCLFFNAENFPKRDLRIANVCSNITYCSTSLFMEIQIKITMRYLLSPQLL